MEFVVDVDVEILRDERQKGCIASERPLASTANDAMINRRLRALLWKTGYVHETKSSRIMSNDQRTANHIITNTVKPSRKDRSSACCLSEHCPASQPSPVSSTKARLAGLSKSPCNGETIGRANG